MYKARTVEQVMDQYRKEEPGLSEKQYQRIQNLIASARTEIILEIVERKSITQPNNPEPHGSNL